MPKVVDREQYRKELLNGCIELFAHKGYGSITMRQIAEGLKVSTGTLYHYFDSKEAIFMQLVQELCEQDISRFFAQAPKAETLEARLQAIMNFVLANIQYYQQQMMLWIDFFQQTRSGSDEEVNFLRQVWNRSRDTIIDYLQLQDPTVAEFLIIFIDGLILQCIYNRGIEDTDWYQSHSQLMIQMILSYEQLSAQT
ncbi:TetR/AcrR family transcriptional regulator [Acaryochloris sp. IP29b_bin.137]|uniref:TetR/AcrR family transcriptional regulator n=1 Tax=Acaryochloris sp. IP29b_bin.137 TaxID=2969217 RepID=UPI002615E480|nr:TetR/AcrR family transcriptional regulator [Acaryochloris sp. IP29b_bin.137]